MATGSDEPPQAGGHWMPGPARSCLLALPPDLLHRIAHLAGPIVCHVCRQLLTAHGPLTCLQPEWHPSADPDAPLTLDLGQLRDPARLATVTHLDLRHLTLWSGALGQELTFSNITQACVRHPRTPPPTFPPQDPLPLTDLLHHTPRLQHLSIPLAAGLPIGPWLPAALTALALTLTHLRLAVTFSNIPPRPWTPTPRDSTTPERHQEQYQHLLLGTLSQLTALRTFALRLTDINPALLNRRLLRRPLGALPHLSRLELDLAAAVDCSWHDKLAACHLLPTLAPLTRLRHLEVPCCGIWAGGYAVTEVNTLPPGLTALAIGAIGTRYCAELLPALADRLAGLRSLTVHAAGCWDLGPASERTRTMLAALTALQAWECCPALLERLQRGELPALRSLTLQHVWLPDRERSCQPGWCCREAAEYGHMPADVLQAVLATAGLQSLSLHGLVVSAECAAVLTHAGTRLTHLRILGGPSRRFGPGLRPAADGSWLPTGLPRLTALQSLDLESLLIPGGPWEDPHTWLDDDTGERLAALTWLTFLALRSTPPLSTDFRPTVQRLVEEVASRPGALRVLVLPELERFADDSGVELRASPGLLQGLAALPALERCAFQGVWWLADDLRALARLELELQQGQHQQQR